jgi:hypothetical protein
MGVTINTIAGSYYACIRTNFLTVSKIPVGEDANMYSLDVGFDIWRDKQSKDNGELQITTKYVRTTSETPITTNVYEIAYNIIKEEAESFVDDDDV